MLFTIDPHLLRQLKKRYLRALNSSSPLSSSLEEDTREEKEKKSQKEDKFEAYKPKVEIIKES
jgi:hypothetical protein